MIAYFLGGCAIYGIVLFVLVMLRPKSALHTKKLTDCGRREKITIGVVLVILILLCTLPMGLAPGWNGEDPGATNQYELVAEAILNGHINIDNGDVDPLLLQGKPHRAKNESSMNHFLRHHQNASCKKDIKKLEWFYGILFVKM